MNRKHPPRLHRDVVWDRLDVEGTDSCKFRSTPRGWTIAGTALYDADGATVKLSYEVVCDDNWRTRTARVVGSQGDMSISLDVERNDDHGWTVNGDIRHDHRSILDIDLGFTPATNTNAIRRLDLQVGADAETTALWLDTSTWTLKPLYQVYRRRSESLFGYSSPLHGYHADLTVDSDGIVLDYPERWTIKRS